MSDTSVGTAIRISQLTGAQGEPSPAEYRKPVIGTVVLPERSVAIDILVKLHAARDAQPGTFTYSDPGRGAGRLSLEGFDADDVERIDDYFRVAELSREAGFAKAPGQFVDANSVTVTPALRNPVIMIVVGSVVAVGALGAAAATVWGPLQASPGQEVGAWATTATLLILAGLGVVIVVQHSTRLRWWLRVRALVIARGERMPHGLRLGE